MTGSEKQTAFYRAYLTDDRSLIPLTVAWATIVGLWLLVYLVSAAAPQGCANGAITHRLASLVSVTPKTWRANSHDFEQRQAGPPWRDLSRPPGLVSIVPNINGLSTYDNVVY